MSRRYGSGSGDGKNRVGLHRKYEYSVWQRNAPLHGAVAKFRTAAARRIAAAPRKQNRAFVVPMFPRFVVTTNTDFHKRRSVAGPIDRNGIKHTHTHKLAADFQSIYCLGFVVVVFVFLMDGLDGVYTKGLHGLLRNNIHALCKDELATTKLTVDTMSIYYFSVNGGGG